MPARGTREDRGRGKDGKREREGDSTRIARYINVCVQLFFTFSFVLDKLDWIKGVTTDGSPRDQLGDGIGYQKSATSPFRGLHG